MYPALYYEPREDGQVQCRLCPHGCVLEPDSFGRCNTRVNLGGTLYTHSYGVLSAISTDPVEKKPLYHFLPGRSILSIGSFGCNLKCDFCQNCTISQIDPQVFKHHPIREPEDIVDKALLHRDNIGLAYTYNEPTVYFEYMIKCAALIKEKRLMNVMVTNGYINKEPLEALLPYMDAFNIDLKSFRDEFYKSRSSASLRPVLETILRVAKSDSHMELTFLLIPGYNDSESEWDDMIRWIEQNCGPDTILHVSKYFPRFKLRSFPTPIRTIQQFLHAASDRIHYVYPGNIPQSDTHTRCPGCGAVVIERGFQRARTIGLDRSGHCARCHFKIKGVFNLNVT
jgi:pyruvate formate lyase activating enzyme